MIRPNRQGRQLANAMAAALSTACALIVVAALVSVLGYTVVRGLPGLTVAFLTRLPRAAGEPGGGLGNALAGTAIMVVLAAAMAVPIGVVTGLYLAGFGRGRAVLAVQFVLDVATGIPSVVIGVFIYSALVRTMGHFSGLAGASALALMMVPPVARQAEAALRAVPPALRDAAFALGMPERRVMLRVLLPAAGGGILSTVLREGVRAAGEAAPLLFTALGNSFWPTRLDQPMAALPLQIFAYALSPYEARHADAWTAALVLTLLVLVTSAGTRLLSRRGRTVPK